MLKSLFSREPETLWKHYVAALSLMMAIVLSSHILEYHAIKSAKHDASLINISGKQRMLSQQILLHAKEHTEQADAVSAFALKSTIEKFESGHARLLQESIEKSVLQSLYLTGPSPVDSLVQDYLDCAHLILQDPIKNRHHYEMLKHKGSGIVIRRLDDAVSGFEAVARTKAQRIHVLQETTLIIAVIVLILEALFIFLPAQRMVKKSLAQLRQEVDEHTATNQRLSNFISIAADLYWETDLAGRISYIDGPFVELLKGGRDTLIGCKYTDLADMSQEHAERMLIALENLESYKKIQAQFVDMDGISYVLNLWGMPRYDKDGAIAGYLGTAYDITDNINLLGEVTRQALTDPLTNVANIRAFESDLKAALQTATDLQPLCLMAMDLDNFKPINDTHGHGAGDEVIKIVAQRIQSVLRDDAWVARTGGDEFCVVCANEDALTLSRTLARRIRRAVSEPIQLGGDIRVDVGISMGIAEAPIHAATFDGLKKVADKALYAAKAAGRNSVHIAQSSLSEMPKRKLDLRSERPVAPKSAWGT